MEIVVLYRISLGELTQWERVRVRGGKLATMRLTGKPIFRYIPAYSTCVVDLNPNPVEPGTFSPGRVRKSVPDPDLTLFLQEICANFLQDCPICLYLNNVHTFLENIKNVLKVRH
jgi:hypothetical protein